jgi:hypothetical protein
VKLEVFDTVGVPLINPPVNKVTPVGNEPNVIVQV